MHTLVVVAKVLCIAMRSIHTTSKSIPHPNICLNPNGGDDDDSWQPNAAED